jgi:hypothetical protein
MRRCWSANAFFLIVSDWDERVFTVEGPMGDDVPWNKAVARAQDLGRRVKCCKGGGNRDKTTRDYGRAYGPRFVEPGSIVRPTTDDLSP